MGDVKKMLEKKQKKKKASSKLDEIDAHLTEFYQNLPSPKLNQTLPCRFSVWVFNFLRSIPSMIQEARNKKKVKIEEEAELNAQLAADEESQKKKSQKNLEKSRLHLELNPKTIEKTDITPVITYNLAKPVTSDQGETPEQRMEKNLNKEWSDKEKTDLIKAIVKFPAGSLNRWNKIGEFVGRTGNECIHMEKQMKTSITSASHSSLNSSSWNGTQKRTVNVGDDPTTRFDEVEAADEDTWSQDQQKLLEKALKEINKDTPNRWDRIAEQVPNKNKVNV